MVNVETAVTDRAADDGSVIATIRTLTCKDAYIPFKIVTDDSFSPIRSIARMCVRACNTPALRASMAGQLSSVIGGER